MSPKNAQHLTDTTPTAPVAERGIRRAVRGRGGRDRRRLQRCRSSATTARRAASPSRPICPAATTSGARRRTPARAGACGRRSGRSPSRRRPRPNRSLISPANYATLDTTTPAFEWDAVPNGVTYQIQIAPTSNFKTPVQDVTLDPGRADLQRRSAGGWRELLLARARHQRGRRGGRVERQVAVHAQPTRQAGAAGSGERHANDRHHARSELEPGAPTR